MRHRFVRCRYAYVRVDTASAIIVPFMAMAVAIAAGQTILALGLVKSIYASPFVALCALVSNRVCLRSGLITAFLAMIGHEFFFSAPYWSLDWPSPEQGLSYVANFLAAFAVARRYPETPERPITPPADQILPFVDSHKPPNDKSFWLVQGGGDWFEDTDVGREYARLYMNQRVEKKAAPTLAWVVRDMLHSGRWTGVEAGFLDAVEAAAISGYRLRRPDLVLSDYDPNDLNLDRPIIKP